MFTFRLMQMKCKNGISDAKVGLKLKIVVGGQKVAQKEALQRLYRLLIWVGGMADVSIVKIAETLADNKILPF
jgi:hypothetical protein